MQVKYRLFHFLLAFIMIFALFNGTVWAEEFKTVNSSLSIEAESAYNETETDGMENQSVFDETESDETEGSHNLTEADSVNTEIEDIEKTKPLDTIEKNTKEERSDTSGKDPLQSDLTYSGKGGMSMKTKTEMYITLVENTNFRWNANGAALKNNVIHLDDYSGENCHYTLTDAGGGFYAIKHIKKYYDWSELYVDVDGNNDKENAVLHLWDRYDYSQENRQFSFHDAGKDDNGRQMYYIQVKGSGLWIGLENNSAPDYHVKIAQVSESKRKAWYVTQNTIPAGLKGGESRLYDNKDDTSRAVFTMSRYGNDGRCVNVNNDAAPVDGNCLHIFYIGTSSKIEAEYNSENEAYILRSRNLDGNTLVNGVTPNMDYVWDVDGADSKEGRVLHIWDKIDKHPSQLWRFIKTDDAENTYKIYNVNSGLWVSLENDSDADNVKLVQSKDATIWEIDFLNKDTNNEGSCWMAKLPDDMPISKINMPGTHDAGASNIAWDAKPQQSMGRAQQYYIDEQLRAGVRVLDIRASTNDDCASDPIIVHGGYDTQCQKQGDKKLYLSDVMSYCEEFLAKNNSETIILCIDGNDRGVLDGCDGNVADAVSAYLDNDYIWQGNDIFNADDLPTLGDVRGKVILQRRYTFEGASDETNALENSRFGMDLTDWDNQPYDQSPNVYLVESVTNTLITDDNPVYDALKSQVWVQDYYKADSPDDKLNIFGDVADYVQNNQINFNTEVSNTNLVTEVHGLVYNYTTTSDSLDSARETNQKILDDSFTRNSGDGDNYFKSHATQKKSMGIVMINYLDYCISKEVYQTNFLPDPESSTDQVSFPESVSLSYGQKLKEADLSTATANIKGTFSFLNAERVMDRLGVQKAQVRFTPEDTNYANVTKNITVHVEPRIVTLNWSGIEARDYDGNSSHVTAIAGNLFGQDSCEVTIENGNAKEPGTHTATAIHLSNANYQLPENCSVEYTINASVANTPETGKLITSRIGLAVTFLVAAAVLAILKQRKKL